MQCLNYALTFHCASKQIQRSPKKGQEPQKRTRTKNDTTNLSKQQPNSACLSYANLCIEMHFYERWCNFKICALRHYQTNRFNTNQISNNIVRKYHKHTCSAMKEMPQWLTISNVSPSIGLKGFHALCNA